MYKNRIVFFIKTCIRDQENLSILLDSINKYNKDKIPVVCSISLQEKKLSDIIYSFDKNIKIVYDQNIVNCFDEQYENNWYSQQLVKLNIHKTNLAKHYIVTDSDVYFIRDFYESDFIYNEDIPYIPVTSHCKAERLPLSLFMPSRMRPKQEFGSKIDKFLNLKWDKDMTLDMPFIITSDYMYAFQYFLEEKNYTFKDLINISPYEMQWYFCFVVARNLKYIPCTSLCLPLHFETQYQIYRLLGFNEHILKQDYIGVLMNGRKVKSRKFKTSFIGSIIRKILKWHHYLTKNNDNCFFKHFFSLEKKYDSHNKHTVLIIFGIKCKFRCKNVNIR